MIRVGGRMFEAASVQGVSADVVESRDPVSGEVLSCRLDVSVGTGYGKEDAGIASLSPEAAAAHVDELASALPGIGLVGVSRVTGREVRPGRHGGLGRLLGRRDRPSVVVTVSGLWARPGKVRRTVGKAGNSLETCSGAMLEADGRPGIRRETVSEWLDGVAVEGRG